MAAAASPPTTVPELQEQLSGWTSSGIPRVKMKIGREPGHDVARVRAARDAIGRYDVNFSSMPMAPIRRKQALAMASSFAESDVSLV